MDSSRNLSVGDLLDQLLADSLIDACHITGDFVTIVQGTKRHSFPYRQARTFLVGMLRGRSWNLKGDEGAHDRAIRTMRAVENRTDESGTQIPAPAATQGLRQEATAGERTAASFGTPVRLIGPALDELLAMAVDMELIEGSSKDHTGNTVTIVLSVCQTQMQFDEAVVFLTECILYKLNAMRDEVLRLSHDAAVSEADRREGGRDAVPVRALAAGNQPVWTRLG